MRWSAGSWAVVVVVVLVAVGMGGNARADSIGGAVVEVVLRVAIDAVFDLAAAGVKAVTRKSSAQSKPIPMPERYLPPDVGEDLSDWIDSRTGSSTHRVEGCGLAVEGRLTGTRHANFLSLTLRRGVGEPMRSQSNPIRLRFGSGRVPPIHLVAPPPAPVPSGEPERLTLRLEKPGFEREDRLSVAFFLVAPNQSECQMTLELARAPGKPADARSFTSYNAFDGHYEFGIPFLAWGGQRTIVTQPSASVELGLNLFPSLHHGFTFDVGMYVWGNGGVEAVAPRTTGAHAALYGWSIFPGYAFRTYPLRPFTLSYGVGAGAYALDILGQSSSDPSVAKWAPAVRAKVKFGASLSQGLTAGLALADTEVFLGKFGATHATGGFLTGGIFVEWGG